MSSSSAPSEPSLSLSLSPSPTPTGESTGTATFTSPQPSVTEKPQQCRHSEVVIELSTRVVIQHYELYYKSTPIHSFQPIYRPLEDGSLVSPPFEEDLFNANFSLLVLGALAAIFIRNIWISGDYLRRGRVKKKTLFYMLFASQLLAPISITPVIISYFLENINCTAVVMLSYLGAMVSLGILITGILGTKAYKCLENPRIVPIVLLLLQSGATAVVIADLVTTRAIRRLSGSCAQVVNLKYTRLFVGNQVAQALFICLCFIYASFRSHGNPAARGRISLRLSTDDVEIDMPASLNDDGRQPLQGRGWWDYVPRSNNTATGGVERHGFGRIGAWFGKLPSSSKQPAPQQRRHHPIYQEPKLQPVQNLGNIQHTPVIHTRVDIPHGRHSPTLSTNSRFSRLFPRMELFQQVLNDELLYTTFITSTCTVVAILVAISVNFKTRLSITVWITINWAFISLLVAHSLGRAVHRHERENWVQQQTASRTGFNTRGVNRPPTRPNRRTYGATPWSSAGISSRNKSSYERYRGDFNDPYSETRPLERERLSWNFDTIDPTPTPSLNRPPLLLAVRNVTPHDSPYQREFEPAVRERTISWQSHLDSSNGRDSASIYSLDMKLGQANGVRL